MTNIVVPQLGESVVEARVAKWLKKPGDRVEAGEAVVELETDKIDLEVGATQDGVLARIARTDGEDVKIGEVLGVIEASQAPPSGGNGAGAQDDVSPKPAAEPRVKAEQPGKARVTPTAQRLAREHQVDVAEVRGSGDGGRVTRQDVEHHLRDQAAPAAARGGAPAPARPAPAAPPPSGERTEARVRMSKRRATIARRLVEAQRTAAMLTTFNEVDMSALAALRARRKASFKERHGVGLGIASFFVKATVAALREFPLLNAEVQGEEMVVKRYYDIGIAVGASEGLVVPVLRDADRLSFAAIERGIRDFAVKARDGSLALEDLRGGTFTITNGGVFGSLLSTPILNPPQVGILGLHKIQDRVVPHQGQVTVRPMMYVALTYDHRIVDGREAVQFLGRVKELVEDPGTLLLES
jgi:2-oxoglutarate dehydrogenase E2 component (dihydrolipoamide succinyltransferase)